jgi:hypothetical protein
MGQLLLQKYHQQQFPEILKKGEMRGWGVN